MTDCITAKTEKGDQFQVLSLEEKRPKMELGVVKRALG